MTFEGLTTLQMSSTGMGAKEVVERLAPRYSFMVDTRREARE